jgi:hypothetical protein
MNWLLTGLKEINRTGATNGIGTTYPSAATEFTFGLLVEFVFLDLWFLCGVLWIIVCPFPSGHCIVCPSSFGHCIVCLSFFGKTGGELRCSGEVSSSFSTCDTRRVILLNDSNILWHGNHVGQQYTQIIQISLIKHELTKTESKEWNIVFSIEYYQYSCS